METLADSLQACIASLHATAKPVAGPLFVGISGAQGCGKSTAVQVMTAEPSGIVALGLDDFYLTAAQRRELGQTVCPLLETRGPPGTHDLELLHHVLEKLARGSPAEVPVFSKVHDDRGVETRSIGTTSPPEIVLLEGWMLGAVAPENFVSAPPLNALENQADAAAWREYQYACLNGSYQGLWDRLHGFVHIEAPDFATVLRWRTQQEASNLGVSEQQLPADRIAWVEQFVQYYQRVTLAMLAGHRRQGQVIRLDEQRRVLSVST
ncbi:MAG: hypothetical protein Hals2KO_18860 [Halioglobus sp.]